MVLYLKSSLRLHRTLSRFRYHFNTFLNTFRVPKITSSLVFRPLIYHKNTQNMYHCTLNGHAWSIIKTISGLERLLNAWKHSLFFQRSYILFPRTSFSQLCVMGTEALFRFLGLRQVEYAHRNKLLLKIFFQFTEEWKFEESHRLCYLDPL